MLMANPLSPTSEAAVRPYSKLHYKGSIHIIAHYNNSFVALAHHHRLETFKKAHQG